MTSLYLDALSPERKEVFLKLKCLADKGTLAGGTALLLQIKHRYSFDFDIFFDKPGVETYFTKLARLFGVKERRVDLPNHQTFFTKKDIQITLFYYEFAPLYTKVKTSSLPLFNLKDIAADKAYTLGRRPMWRDYVDLFFLLKEKHVVLKDLIRDAKRKFKTLFDAKLFLQQLIYFGDIRNFEVDYINKKYSPKKIQSFLKKEVLKYTKKEIG